MPSAGPTITLDKSAYQTGATMTATVTPQAGASTSLAATVSVSVAGVAGTAVPYEVNCTSFNDSLGKVWTRTSAAGVSPAVYTATA